MLFLQLGFLLILLAVCSFAPGFFLVRKLPWNPLEKLCGAVGLSLVMVYLAEWGVYCFTSFEPGGIIAAACALLGILARKDISVLFGSSRVRRTALGYLFLLAWTLTILAMIRHYSGFGWGGDWLEHFQRSLFFLHRFPTSTPIIHGYLIPARPPMMNVLTAFYLSRTQDSFALFQVVFTFFNLLLYLPCCLLLPALGLSRRPRILLLTALFALNPVVMENATYSWTKSLASFFVILALWFYTAALRKKDSGRMVAAFLSLAAGLLVHYLAGPYILFLALHYLLRTFWKRPRKWRELAVIAVSSGLLLATWFGWSVARYGADVTLKSNTSVTSAQKYQGNTFVRIGANILNSVVPYVLWGRLQTDETSRAGLVRDYAFTVYQVNLIFGMGLAGGIVVAFLLWRFTRRSKSPPEWRFWRVLIPVCIVIGIAVVGERDRFGSAHLTLLPLEALGLALIAASYPWKRAVAVAIAIGGLADFSLGVFLQARIEAMENTPGRTVFNTAVGLADGGVHRASQTADGLSVAAWENWELKHRFEIRTRYLQQIAGYQPEDAQAREAIAKVRASLLREMKDDDIFWHGWWKDHNYRLAFLGDEVAGANGNRAIVPQSVLLSLFLALVFALYREMRPPRLPAAKVPEVRAPRKRK